MVKAFYKDFGFIVAFLILVLVIQMSLGNNFTNKFLVLVLFGMIILNSNNFIIFLQNSFELKKGE